MPPTNPRPPRRLRRRLLAVAVGALLAVVSLEIGSFVLVRTGVLSARVPS